MHIELSEEADEFIRRAVETGRHRRPEDAVREALELWIERERERDEILAAIEVAEAELARGEGIELTKDVDARIDRRRETSRPQETCDQEARPRLMAFRLAPRARAGLDGIWDCVFSESGSEAIADRLLDSIGDRFDFLADWPRSGKRRDDYRAATEATPSVIT